ncbi:MAG: Arc family DNA-binding protein [Acidobacteria bacterium]|jgi:plasmid stability protein|nr:Arc family DNA-binding protein [Acidobacteriota bacterium]
MAVTLKVENVPEEVAARLEERARKSRRSLQGELLRILEKAVAEEDRLTPLQVLEKVRSLKLKTPAESAAFVRQDRDAH